MDLLRLIRPLLVLPFILSCSDTSDSFIDSEPKSAPLEVFRFCESESGQSRFFVHLDLVRESGEFRYQFLEQDILYRASSVRLDSGRMTGEAEFVDSGTGEVRATHFRFEFDWNEDTFEDGLNLFNCSPLQDVSLMQLPKGR